MSLLLMIRRKFLPAFQGLLIGFTSSIVLFILLYPQRSYRIPFYTLNEFESVDYFRPKSDQLPIKHEAIIENEYGLDDKDLVDGEDTEMTGIETDKLDEELEAVEEKERTNELVGDNEKPENTHEHNDNVEDVYEPEDEETDVDRTMDELAYNISKRPGKEKRLPQALVIGIKKCGTDILMDFLDVHPHLKPTKKESHFFNKKAYKNGLDYYRKHMPVSSLGEITIEKTPNYFEVEVVPSRVKRMNSTIKLILIARDPVKRLISDYVHNSAMRRKEKHHTFEEMVFNDSSSTIINENYKPVRVSKYHIHLTRWLKYFPRNQILVLDGEQFTKNPVPALKTVEQFLGVESHITKDHFAFVKKKGPKGFYCKKYIGKPLCMGSHKGRSHPNVTEPVLNRLYEFYKPHNKLFYDIVGQSYTWDR